MITLLLTATMCHALNVQNSFLISTEKERKDDDGVKAFEKAAHTAHELSVDELEGKLQGAEDLLDGLSNHKNNYQKTGNPRQAERTQKRIERLENAINTIKKTIASKQKRTLATGVTSTPELTEHNGEDRAQQHHSRRRRR